MCSAAEGLLLAPARSALKRCGAVVPFGGVSYRLARVSWGENELGLLRPKGQARGRAGKGGSSAQGTQPALQLSLRARSSSPLPHTGPVGGRGVPATHTP